MDESRFENKGSFSARTPGRKISKATWRTIGALEVQLTSSPVPRWYPNESTATSTFVVGGKAEVICSPRVFPFLTPKPKFSGLPESVANANRHIIAPPPSRTRLGGLQDIFWAAVLAWRWMKSTPFASRRRSLLRLRRRRSGRHRCGTIRPLFWFAQLAARVRDPPGACFRKNEALVLDIQRMSRRAVVG